MSILHFILYVAYLCFYFFFLTDKEVEGVGHFKYFVLKFYLDGAY